jgi:hypothetical protein
VAVAGDEFVLEVPEDRRDIEAGVRDFVVLKAATLLRTMAKGCCACRWASAW